MKQWMRRFFAVLMMACLLAGCTAWAEKAHSNTPALSALA